MSKSRYPGIHRLSAGRYQVRVTWIDPKTGKKKDQKKVIAAASMAEANSQRELLRAQLLTSGTTQRERVRLGEYASSSGEDPEDPTEVDRKVGLSRNPVDGSTDKRRPRRSSPTESAVPLRKTAPPSGAVIARWSGK